MASPGDGSTDLLIADELATERFVARRVWHSAMQLSDDRAPAMGWRADAASGRVVGLMLQVDGDVDVASGPATMSLSPHDAVLYPAQRGIAVASSTATARIEIIVRMQGSLAPDSLQLLPSEGMSAASSALSSVVNSILNSESRLRPLVLETLHRVFANHVELMVAERQGLTEGSGSGPRLYVDALAFIEAWGHSPSFSVESIVEWSGVSRQYLTRLFSARGTTPGRELRRHRVELARRLLAAGQMSVDEVAPWAGFRSTRAMKDALAAVPPSSETHGVSEEIAESCQLTAAAAPPPTRLHRA